MQLHFILKIVRLNEGIPGKKKILRSNGIIDRLFHAKDNFIQGNEFNFLYSNDVNNFNKIEANLKF